MKEQLQVDELPVIENALKQYKKNLDNLIQNDDTANNDLFVNDLSELSKQTKYLMDGMNHNPFNLVDRNKSFISPAVSSYLKYLQETRKYVYDKLGAKPKLKFIDNEIELAEKIIPKLL
jgi:hypothetical protein